MSERQWPADKRSVRAAFDRAAPTYDAVAQVQRMVCDRLLALARRSGRQPGRLLDAGCGTGYALPALAAAFPGASRVALDFAPAMLSMLPEALPAVCGDLEALPFGDASFDTVWSSLAVQWCHPATVFGEIARVLAPGGEAWIATLGPGTLWELRQAFASVDTAEHVIGFRAQQEIANELAASGLSVEVSERATVRAWAPDLRTLLADIKALGAHSLGAGRRRAPLGRQAWVRLMADYEQHRTADGLPASYDVLWFIAHKT
ncbi:MAG: malonyl-ACP O-methyltransferase BioC [Zoogloea sp.]|nr:malonyl-ACP O-methyltransferase BioC [Zoogloea sp.]